MCPLTGQTEENQPVYNQHRPENGQIEDLEPTAEETDRNRLGRRVPELEFWEPTHEWPELLVLFGGQPAGVAVLHIFTLL
jgi:hypothetical protein